MVPVALAGVAFEIAVGAERRGVAAVCREVVTRESKEPPADDVHEPPPDRTCRAGTSPRDDIDAPKDMVTHAGAR